MRKERTTIPVRVLELNTGQVDWLPRNPRQWTDDDVARTEASVREDPDFLEDRPLLVVPKGHKFVAFAGNLRLTACRKAGIEAAPCIVYHPESDEDHVTVVRRAMKDNGSFGSWDFDALANEWGDLPLADWGVPVWETEKGGIPDGGLSSAGKEGADGYDAFVEKFETKLTTDDCYTPPEVYDAIVGWVDDNFGPIDRAKIVRPFYPGGDYQRLDQYPDGCIVLDNPPFSIYAEIVRYYLEHGITFFLFGPHLTLKVKHADVTYVVCGQGVTYENGAVVNTSFVTNHPKLAAYRIYIPTSLYRIVGEVDHELQKKADLARYRRPAELWTIPVLSKIAKGEVDFGIKKEECEEIQNIECLKEMGKSLFGGGYLLGTAAAREAAAIEAAAREAAAREAKPLTLNQAEKAIVARIDARLAQLSTDTGKAPETAN